jgi:hypothetical protein
LLRSRYGRGGSGRHFSAAAKERYFGSARRFAEIARTWLAQNPNYTLPGSEANSHPTYVHASAAASLLMFQMAVELAPRNPLNATELMQVRGAIGAPCTQCPRHRDPIHKSKGLTRGGVCTDRPGQGAPCAARAVLCARPRRLSRSSLAGGSHRSRLASPRPASPRAAAQPPKLQAAMRALRTDTFFGRIEHPDGVCSTSGLNGGFQMGLVQIAPDGGHRLLRVGAHDCVSGDGCSPSARTSRRAPPCLVVS